MAKHKIKINLSVNSIQKARQDLQSYKTDLLKKTQLFVERLAEIGIEVAEQHTGGYGKYIEFRMETEPTETGCKAIVIARDKQMITSEWVTRDGKKTASVSPLLMAEYGSGKYAVDGHRGTFPGQTHAFDPNGWWYMDTSNKWHHRYGVEPYRPMYTAYLEMIDSIKKVSEEVFK